MPNILRISEAASLALHTAVLLAVEPEKLHTTRGIAETLKVSEAHLSKVMQRLVKEGLVNSVRGPKGGFTLAVDPGQANLLNVYEMIEGPLLQADCLLGKQICDGSMCILGPLIYNTNKAVRDYLANTKLDDLTSVYKR